MAIVQEDGSIRGEGCWFRNSTIKGDEEVVVTCGSCFRPITASGAKSACQNKRCVKINGREVGGSGV